METVTITLNLTDEDGDPDTVWFAQDSSADTEQLKRSWYTSACVASPVLHQKGESGSHESVCGGTQVL